MIEKMKNTPLNLQSKSVYNFNEFTLTELLNRFFTTINECVDSSNTSLQFLTWLKGEGLPIEVEKELNLMYKDGRLQESIDKISGDLTIKINQVNEELNNNIELFTQEVDTKIDSVNDNNEQLKTKLNTTNSNIQKLNNHNIIFNRKFGSDFNMYRGTEPRKIEDITNYLTKLYNNGCRKLIVVVSIGIYNSSSVTLLQDIEFIRQYTELAKNIGFEVDTLKIHWKDNTMNTITPTLSDSVLQYNYLNPYTNIVTNLMDEFKDLFTDIVVLNECSIFYKSNSNYVEFTNNLLTLGKIKGYKVGIATMGANESLSMDTTIQQNVDKFYMNIYPFMSYKLNLTNVNDCIHSWNNSYEIRTIKTLKTLFPNKDIVITETGCLDYYESLASPGVWNMGGFSNTNGQASSLMIESMFKSELKDYIKEVYWCYWETISFDNVGKIIKYYTQGGIDNV